MIKDIAHRTAGLEKNGVFRILFTIDQISLSSGPDPFAKVSLDMLGILPAAIDLPHKGAMAAIGEVVGERTGPCR